MKINYRNNKGVMLFSLILLGILVLSACTPAAAPTAAPAPTQDVAAIQTQSAQTVVADLTAGAPTATPPPPGPTTDPNIPVAILPTPAAGEPAATALYNASIYSGPGTNYVLYATLLGGANAKVVGKSEDGLWWAISIPIAPTGAGWVEAGYVTVSNADNVQVLPTPPVPPTVEMVPPGPTDPQLITIANVYVRSGPGTNYPAYGLAPFATTGRVIGKSEDGKWWVVRVDPTKISAGYAWVSGDYTQASNVESVQTIKTPPAPATVMPPPPPSGVGTATSIDYVNVRSGPGTNYTILAVAPPGATGEVTGKSSDGAWWQVKIPTAYSADGLGWVSADWVVTQGTDSTPVVTAPPAPPPAPATPPPATSSSCYVSQSPADGTVFGAGTSFTTTWVLQNNTGTSWDGNSVDLRYVGAAANVPLHQGSDIYDLANTVEPGWTYNFSVPMIAPFTPGVYGEVWEVGQGSNIICQFYVYIEVR
ncbi:MAG: SH3 domain-containing protein [Bacteroidota bacterium]